MSGWGYILFHTTAAAFKAERAVQGVPDTRLVPTPREYSSDCGVALRFRPGDIDLVRAALQSASVPFDRVEGCP
jgi:hypothetical protein